MANVCVITGGGSGMGLETARNIDKDVILVLTGRTVSKLEKAKEQLEAEGHQVHLIACDVSVRKDVHELCLFADSLGTIKTVIHAAGLSPTMADAEKIIMVNPQWRTRKRSSWSTPWEQRMSTWNFINI